MLAYSMTPEDVLAYLLNNLYFSSFSLDDFLVLLEAVPNTQRLLTYLLDSTEFKLDYDINPKVIYVLVIPEGTGSVSEEVTV